jgi:D-arabinose 1-dehydrogenase-like Zn-dependent alcohol dehydrogenase
MHIDGVFAEYAAVPQDICVKLPTGLSLESGALLEAAGVAVHAIQRANYSVAGRAVLVSAPGASDWVAVAAAAPHAAVRGFRISGAPTAPMHTGVAVRAANVEIDDVTFDGTIAVAVDIDGSDAVVRSSTFDQVTGVGVRVGDGLVPSIRHNLFYAPAHVVHPDTRAAALPANGNMIVPAAAGR